MISGNDGMSRAEKERLFVQDFIGTSDFALSCRISNLKDITLLYNKKSNTLTAYSTDPIEIENKKLGYHIRYFLDRFIVTPKNITIAGNYSFKETSHAKKILANRKVAYEGSRMHFVRALWNNTLSRSGFEIYSRQHDILTEDSVLIISNSKKYVELKSVIAIRHSSNTYQISYLNQDDHHAFIGKEGFYNAVLHWSGKMGLERVGDLLPYEYEVEN